MRRCACGNPLHELDAAGQCYWCENDYETCPDCGSVAVRTHTSRLAGAVSFRCLDCGKGWI